MTVDIGVGLGIEVAAEATIPFIDALCPIRGIGSDLCIVGQTSLPPGTGQVLCGRETLLPRLCGRFAVMGVLLGIVIETEAEIGEIPTVDDGISRWWSASRYLFPTGTYNGPWYIEAPGGGLVQSFLEQSGDTGKNFTDTTLLNLSLPTLTTAGLFSRTCLDFDGAVDILNTDKDSTGSLDDFISPDAGWFIVSFMANTIIAGSANQPWQYPAVIGDFTGGMGLTLKEPDEIVAFNFTVSGADSVSIAGIATGTVYVAEWWHDNGELFLCINNGTPVSVASGDEHPAYFGERLGIGQGYTGTSEFFNGKIFEIGYAPTVPVNRSQVAQYFMDWVGAV